ncbi:hypothetical protein EJ04DRAFT_512494 [Polyplosphaeria fusca]|uniref:Uncharacterized protein n=1 Tax=Polyplosphaeria fusca TaxID=682080 RepID=A0A9P4R0G2_9PLEO|nr:hypothetical protein EJ04DRAFT_512494 [Polyplosphaeria fusca]
MFSLFELLLIGFGTIKLAAASSISSGDFVTWLHFQRNAIVKLDTPGYPLWLMDKANAPIMYEDAENFYYEMDEPSAILLNVSMSQDSKTLLINDQPVLPFANYDVPPRIGAFQVPAEYTSKHVISLKEQGLFDGYWQYLTLSLRYLALDYDRLVWADPFTGPYQNHEPTLNFRIMGLGAHSRSDVLDATKQKVLTVTLSDSKHGSSDAWDRSYGITKIEIKEPEKAYVYAPATEPSQEACTTKSWKCPDKGLYSDDSPPPYRFIWRSRFDEYGRIGSRRHALFRKIDVLRKFFKDAGPSMLLSFCILFGLSMLGMATYYMVKKCRQGREKEVRDLAHDDSLLGEFDGEKYFDEEDSEDEEGVPPPLPPRPQQVGVLIDLEAAQQA